MSGNLLYSGLSGIDLIMKRVSVRTYSREPLSDQVKEKLKAYFNDIKGPFDIKVRFMLVEKELFDEAAKLGTYGIVKNADVFIAAAVERGNMYLEQLGYKFEKAVLYATSLGLGTCWMGGTFKKAEFAKVMDLKEEEELLIVSPVGYSSNSRSMIDTAMRFLAGSKERKGWDGLFFDGGFNKPLSREKAGTYSIPLEMVRLAPSASNKQPWRIVMQDGYFNFYLMHSKGYTRMSGYDIQRVDMGIAMCHFELVCEETGEKGFWVLLNPKTGNVPEGAEYIISWKMEKFN